MKASTIARLLIAVASSLLLTAQQSTPANQSENRAILVELADATYPQMARMANVYGDVEILVTIGRDGAVQATAVTKGHAMLKQAALDSAAHSRFECPSCTASTTYRLIYEFKMVQGENCCEALSRPQQIQATLNLPEEQLPTSRVTVTVEHGCICDPAATVTRRVRSIKCLYLWKCSTRRD